MADLPDALPQARPRIDDLPESLALSVLLNGPDSFTGRKIGVLVTQGADAALLTGLQDAAAKRGVTLEVVAPTVMEISTDGGTEVPVDQKLDGAPSVLYDAVVVLADASGADTLASLPAGREFVADAFAHCKFIGYPSDARGLLEAVLPTGGLDGGCIALDSEDDVALLFDRCADLRFWDREAALG